MRIIAEMLTGLAAHSVDDLVLVAPFIKSSVLSELLLNVSPDTEVSVITRWLPQEISSGVSDIEVWDVVRARPSTSLWLRQDLHAKYYRGDGACLIGSANLTRAALGLSPSPNYELLIPVDAATPALADFEHDLKSAAVEVDETLAESMRKAVDSLPPPPRPGSETAAGGRLSVYLDTWIPSLRNPEDLFIAYAGEQDSLSSDVAYAADEILRLLGIPVGLEENAFRSVVAASTAALPVFSRTMRFIDRPRRFGEVRDFVGALRGSPGTSTQDWQTMLRWLLYFHGNRFAYRKPRHSEIIMPRI